MARAESKMIMGYLPIEERHHAAILSLLAPATPTTRMLDPFAGEGLFLDVAAKTWQVTPYANELEAGRAAACIERFGPKQAVQCDVERLMASNEAFGILWANPPYDHDKTAKNSKRIEFAYLRHSWKWAQHGAIIFWVVYNQHITEEAAAFLAKYSSQVDVWALPGKHQGEYDQVVVVAVKGTPTNPESLYEQILAGKASPRPLTVQPEAVYRVPVPLDPARKFVFSPDVIDEVQGLRLLQDQGAWKTNGFQALLEVQQMAAQQEPIVPPRPGHMALVLTAGVANGAIIPTAEYGKVAIRGKIHYEEQVARVETEVSPSDPDHEITKTTMRLKPTTVVTLLAEDGTQVEMNGDSALLDFITQNKAALAAYLNTKFHPIYQFDFDGLRPWLDRIRLKGKHELYTAQKHVIAATTQGLQHRKKLWLIGQMGVGKTALGGTAAIALATQTIQTTQSQMKPDQVTLIVAPPHLIDKWQRELHSISHLLYVERLERHEDVKAFMDKAARLGSGIAKIGLIKRDMTKLGVPIEVGVVWKTEYIPLWGPQEPTPNGYEPTQRLSKRRVPICPHCGQYVEQESKGHRDFATEAWLKSGRRTCEHCLAPLWQEARNASARPKAGQKYATQNPRYRMDKYIKRFYRHRVHLLIWDEVHECQHGDTGNGEAFARMAGFSEKVLAMTGTPFNGRASSLFNVEYALNPRIRRRFPWGGAPRLSRKVRGSNRLQFILDGNDNQRGHAESRWVAEMGVREQVIEDRPTYDKDTGVYTGTSTYERPYEEAPGISPMLVAELLDHAIFFSLGDLGKCLPTYEEIAVPVELDADLADLYSSTRQKLKDYLIARRWEGDTTFRGAYLQWSMSWPNAAFRPYPVIHNIRNPLTKQKSEHIIAHLPSFGEGRIYAKEQKLIDLVQAELAEDRPVVIFIRQTATRDIQPRIEALLRQHIPSAKPFILKNTVAADRREKVIEAEVAKGTNVILSNPELVKTGLDLVFAPTLIFYEITFNLGTMMQAAGRSLRLNQTHEHCKTYYLYCTDTMEETAVQLMSRKQRAAKLLNGDIGLTGLDALTEGEGGFEEALLDAIGREEALIDPTQLFKSSVVQNEIYAEDAAYWNVEVVASESMGKPAHEVIISPILVPEPAAPMVNLFDTPAQLEAVPDSALIQTSIQADVVLQALTDCGGAITSITTNSSSIMPPTPTKPPVKQAKKIKHRRINLLAVPADEPISVLELLAGKPTKPAVPAALPVPVVNPKEVVQLALW